MKQKVVIGLLGPILDGGKEPKRWERWRPTVALCQHEELLVHRFDLIYQRRYASLLKRIIADIHQVSPETEVVPHCIEFDNPWDFEEVFAGLHDFARGYSFDTEQEEYLIHITTGTHVAQICLFLLTEAHYFSAKLIQTSPSSGAEKNVAGTYTVIDLDLSKYDLIATRFNQEKRDDISFLKSGIETRSPRFNALIEQIERVAINSIDPILLTGPTGAGKSQLARRIYELKKVKRQIPGAFVEVNCATLRGDGAMSTLFGHRRGAFTGALQDRPGLLRAADKGMLFLDEIGELGLDEQAMLLRAIEEHRFLPLGSDAEAQSDFQLLCGTNRDLGQEVTKGGFRGDLLARINLWTFSLPGLAKRVEDIEPNLEYELERFAERSGTRITFNQQAKKRFLEFSGSPEACWPANFRDLNGAVRRMATLAPAGRITIEVVEEEITRLLTAWRNEGPESKSTLVQTVIGEEATKKLDYFDQVQLAEVIRICQNATTLSDAGRKLFAVSREGKKSSNDADRLRKYLARFDLDWEEIKKVMTLPNI